MLSKHRVSGWGASFAMSAVLLLGGCSIFGGEPTRPSPQTGEEMTDAQLDAEEQRLASKLAAEDRAAAIAADAELAKAQRETEYLVSQQTIAAESRIAEIIHEAEIRYADIRVEYTTGAELRAAAKIDMAAVYDAERANIQSERERQAATLGSIQRVLDDPATMTVANMILPIGGAAVVGLLSGFFGRMTGKTAGIAKGKAEATQTAQVTVRAAEEAAKVEAERARVESDKRIAEMREKSQQEIRDREYAAYDAAKRDAAEAQARIDASWEESAKETKSDALPMLLMQLLASQGAKTVPVPVAAPVAVPAA